ncbi:Protein kinase domain-containing protein [Mycena sanguinolenta]|uniref:Cyclin-dependent kinase 8 n=1 Tax=Mycena sanguinolenta TaxID=230812 RepID=A0A8H6YIQ6_9AGAR|nr:Protein kinase domain-containing protein [Mycena sanguinolenta]
MANNSPSSSMDEWASNIIQNDPMRMYRAKRDATRRSVSSKYSILGFISSGTYGRVYKAQSLGEDVKIHAIKKFKPDKEGDVITYTGISQSAIREIALNREIDHENIVALKESLTLHCHVGDSDSTPWQQVIQHHATTLRTPISLSVLKSLIYQLFNGLIYLHSCHILHRDLKPANILINAQGVVKIGDLGLARLIYQPLQPLFAGDKVVVTIWYRAPELLMGAKHYNKAIDCWAVGCVMAELASLRPIFKGEEAKLDSKKNVPFQRDQLLKIFEVLGTPDEQDWPGVKDMVEYQNMKRLDPYTNRLYEWCTTRVRSQNGYDLLRQLFAYDPDNRLTAKEALQHKWFHEEPLPTWNAFQSSPQQIPPHRRITQDEAPSMVPLPAAPFNSQTQSKPGSSASLSGGGAYVVASGGERGEMDGKSNGSVDKLRPALELGTIWLSFRNCAGRGSNALQRLSGVYITVVQSNRDLVQESSLYITISLPSALEKLHLYFHYLLIVHGDELGPEHQSDSALAVHCPHHIRHPVPRHCPRRHP